MPPFQYTQADLQAEMNRGIQGRQGLLIDPIATMNAGVREALSELRIRSTKRKTTLVPNLVYGPFQYVLPSDCLGSDIIDIPAQAKRYDGEFTLVPPEQFARAPKKGDIAIDDYNGIRVLLIDSRTHDQSVTIDPITVEDSGGNNIWNAFGDGDNVRTDSDQYIKGAASVAYDIDGSGGTTAGIEKDALPTIDLSGFIGQAARFVTYSRLTSATGVLSIKLRLGTSPTDYFEFTVTTRLDGTAFANGQNLLAFDASIYTVTGSPDENDITYVSLFLVKETSKINENGYAFNMLEARKGQYADAKYYSKCGWTTSAGVYIKNSTTTTDLLVADQDEFDLIVKKVLTKAVREADLGEAAVNRADQDWKDAKAIYAMENPGEDKVVISSYHHY
jgi:hypothetical protein